MKDVLINLLYILITTCGTAVVGFVCTLLKKKITEISARTKNTVIKNSIDKANEIVLDAVQSVSQTYVEALKKNGGFTKSAQVEAKNKAIDIVESLITDDLMVALTKAYGSFDIWLSTTIESYVAKLKK